ncbi:MAG TPA: efflux RND transporter periplasmic adaptor subunit [Bacteroidales bacterium]|nr:efflux RND transporter periplasmic adaptor subunit [Bacteroidales bacterium]
MKKILFIVAALIAFTFSSCKNSGDTEHSENPEGASHSSEIHDEPGHAGEVQLTAAHMSQMGIVVKPLNGGTVDSEIQRPATVMFVPDNTVRIGPRITAKVEKVMVDLGQHVSAGQSLASLSSIELGRIKAEYLGLKSRFETEQEAYKREKKLYEEKISSASEYLQARSQFDHTKAELESAEETLKLFGIPAERVGKNDYPLSYFVLKSPISGIVQERNLSPGQTLSSESTPIHIVNNSEMWLMTDAYESDIANIRKGQGIVLTIKSLPGKQFEGEVDWISNALDQGTRTLKIRATIDNPDGLLKDGMYGTGNIKSHKDTDMPIVPVDAVQTVDNKKVIFVPGDEDRSFMPIEVSTGKENNGWIEIAGNIRVGEPVVTHGAFELMSVLTSGSRSAAHHH